MEKLSRTIFRALSMSMPWLQGTAGLARQSPALPLRDTSTRWRRRYLKASAITRMASWVRADVYCKTERPEETPVTQRSKVIISPAALPARTQQSRRRTQDENQSLTL